jgi:WD40 repeat protein
VFWVNKKFLIRLAKISIIPIVIFIVLLCWPLIIRQFDELIRLFEPPFSPDVCVSSPTDTERSPEPFDGQNLHFEFLRSIDTGGYSPTDTEFSPDNQYFYEASFRENTLRIYDTESWEVVQSIAANQVSEIAISDDGQRLAAVLDYYNSIRVWDLATEDIISSLEFPNHVHDVLFGSDSNTLMTGGSEGLQIWDLSTNQVTTTLPFHRRLSTHEVVRIEANHAKSCLLVWDSEMGDELYRDRYSSLVNLSNLSRFNISVWDLRLGLEFSPDGSMFTVADDAWGTIDLVDTLTLETRHQFTRALLISEFFPTAPIFVTTSYSYDTGIAKYELVFWDLNSYEEISRLKLNIASSIYDLKISADGSVLVVVGIDGIYAWRIRN